MPTNVPYRFAVRPLTYEEGGGYLIEFPDLPGCMSPGKMAEATIVTGVDAVRGSIVVMQAEGLPVSALVQPSMAE